VLVAGGNAEYCANAMTPGGSKSWVFDVSPGANHTWIEEQTAFPRVVRYTLMMNDILQCAPRLLSICHSMHEPLLIYNVPATVQYKLCCYSKPSAPPPGQGCSLVCRSFLFFYAEHML